MACWWSHGIPAYNAPYVGGQSHCHPADDQRIQELNHDGGYKPASELPVLPAQSLPPREKAAMALTEIEAKHVSVYNGFPSRRLTSNNRIGSRAACRKIGFPVS